MNTYERLLDKAHALLPVAVGPGAAISVDPDPTVGRGFVARAWNGAGHVACTDEVGRPNRAGAVRALMRQLQQTGFARQREARPR